MSSCSHSTQEGGELYFSDMYASKVIPDHMKTDPRLWGKITLYCGLKIQCKRHKYRTPASITLNMPLVGSFCVGAQVKEWAALCSGRI